MEIGIRLNQTVTIKKFCGVKIYTIQEMAY